MLTIFVQECYLLLFKFILHILHACVCACKLIDLLLVFIGDMHFTVLCINMSKKIKGWSEIEKLVQICGCISGTSGGRRISNTREPQNFGCDSEMKCVYNDYTNSKTLTTLTLTLTDLHSLINKFLSAIPSRKTSMTANTLCTEICVY